ncbi:Cobalt-zinc-cadmium resistance protein [Liberibacter crescens BT-1]|uniref:Protein p34 n=1 Tax=Liberibacter crescens (strain BT-1) TaxID=1215343 RepID=L0EU63_LIBCB|nr:cation diffusion facilitator family transporter [Liberibacter crescens]AGA65074.1 Cobalt-zinc-cadmium resistance protein [Liberibacter crescens BT-1]AMC13062.1 cation transporter [Liberibacter crescens]
MIVNNNNIILKLAFIGIPVSILVTSLKFLAWYLTGFVSLLSDSLESIINIATALITYFTIRYAQQPADNNHPFGHQKAEYIAAVVEGILIIAIAFMILQEVWFNTVKTSISETPIIGLTITIFASVINFFWGYFLIKTGKEKRSPALQADGQHINSDVLTSISIVFGLIIVMVTGYTIVDPIIATMVAIHICYQGCKLVYDSIKGLMDSAVDPELEEKIRKTIAAHAIGSLGVHDLKTRQAGALFFVDFHLVVRSDMTVANAHKICDRLEKAIENSTPGAMIAIHIEPESEKAHGINVALPKVLDHA